MHPVTLLRLLIAILAAASLACSSGPNDGRGRQADPASAPQTQTPTTVLDGPRVLAQKQILFNGLRTPITEVLQGEPALDLKGREIAIELGVPGRPGGSQAQSPAVNLGAGFDNYVIVQALDGPLRLFLHRDGSLRETPDAGELGSFEFSAGEGQLTYTAVLNQPITGSQYTFNVNLTALAQTAIRIAFTVVQPAGG